MYVQTELDAKWRENKTRDERREQFARILEQQGRGGITLLQICKMAGVKKSPYTRELIADLCNARRARWDWAVTYNGREVRVFFPVKEA